MKNFYKIGFKKDIYKKLTISLIILFFVFNFFSCDKGKYKLFKETRFLFDSFFEIDLFANDDIKYKEDINTIFDEIENLGNELDFRDPDSLISKQKSGETFEIPYQYFELFKVIDSMQRYTEGYFNPFLRDLILSYKDFKDGTVPPSKEEVKKLATKSQNYSIWFDPENKKVFVKSDGLLDLGAVVAGFLVDYAYERLNFLGYKDFLINGSGEIRVSGKKNGKEWVIGIKNPDSNGIISKVNLPSTYSIATSGSYERFFIYDGVKYHHILNPFTGLPDSKIISCSIIDAKCLNADLLSTAIFAMGIEKARQFCLENKIHYLLIYEKDGKLILDGSTEFQKIESQ